jgi:hypothetical protein
MKTLFVCAKRNVDRHDGEEYDDILEVEDQPTTETIQDWANRMMDHIRKLNVADAGSADRGVSVFLDAASPYNAMLINLQILMKANEGIRIELPYLKSTVPTTDDPEAVKVIEKLEGRRM